MLKRNSLRLTGKMEIVSSSPTTLAQTNNTWPGGREGGGETEYIAQNVNVSNTFYLKHIKGSQGAAESFNDQGVRELVKKRVCRERK